MRGRDDIDLVAAEYALGTLDAEVRSDVDARRLREPDLDAAILAWDNRLAALLDGVGEEAPPPELFPLIESAIDRGTSDSGANVIALDTLRRQLNRWRGVAIGATALAAALGGVLIMRDAVLPPSTQTFVAVFHDGDTQPRFLLSMDLQSREMTIRPVSAEALDDKVYELWIVGEGISPVPRSLGLLQDVSSPTHRRLDRYDPDLLRQATFGISIEPPGGSSTGQPTGLALHGTLIPTVE